MKRKIIFILLALALVAMIPAQEQQRGEGQSRFRRPAAETVTVSGTMVVARGMPALKSGDVTYYVSGISSLVGFIDGLKEGAQVTIAGLVISNPRDETAKFLRSSTLTISGKSYDLAVPGWNQGSMWQMWRPFGHQNFQRPQAPQPGTPQAPRTPPQRQRQL